MMQVMVHAMMQGTMLVQTMMQMMGDCGVRDKL